MGACVYALTDLGQFILTIALIAYFDCLLTDEIHEIPSDWTTSMLHWLHCVALLLD